MPAVLTLIISIWGIGRFGILTSFVLLLGLLFVRLQDKSKYIYYVIICLFIAYLFYVLSMHVMDNSIFSNAIDHYSARKMETGSRFNLWMNYFNNLDISRIIFGVNVVEDPWPEGEINAYNYHNSFINLHLQTGFMGLITLALIILAFFKFYRINRAFFFLLLTLILRASSDLFIFFNRFDFIPFFFIFYFLSDVAFKSRVGPLSVGISGTIRKVDSK